MHKRKRHTQSEIATKLAEANALATAGRTQSELARALGISVMTFHRWRKAQLQWPQSKSGRESEHIPIVPTAEYSVPERTMRISELQLENMRLRKLVTDLLLEKMNFDEGVHQLAGHGARQKISA